MQSSLVIVIEWVNSFYPNMKAFGLENLLHNHLRKVHLFDKRAPVSRTKPHSVSSQIISIISTARYKGTSADKAIHSVM